MEILEMKSSGKRSPPPPPGPCPWLVYNHGKNYNEQTFCCNISGPLAVKTYRKKIPSLLDKKVLSCSYGWLVLYDNNTNVVSLCNTTNFASVDLPSLELSRDNEIDSCILSSSPKNPDCKVLLFLKKVQCIMCCGFKDEEWSWSEIKYGNKLNAIDPRREEENPDEGTLYFCKTLICGGKIYAELSVGGVVFYPELWTIEIVEEGEVVLNRINNRTKWIHRISCRVNQYVLESNGELFSLLFMWGGVELRDILKIEVNKLNSDTMVWEILENIKDRSFFVCPDYCLSCPASAGQGHGHGCIYFTRGEDQSLYCYDMEDESTLVSLPRTNLPTPWRSAIWIMPQELIRPQEDCCTCNDSNQGQNDTVSLDSKEYCEEDSVKNGSGKLLSELPFDVLQQVTKHFLAFDYLNFRSMSRLCRSVAPPINWRTSLSGSEISLAFPLLMFPQKGQRLYNLVDPRVNNSYFIRNIPEILKQTTILYSNQGWLLMLRKRAIHLYNPFTGDVISTKTPNYHDSFFFASKPSGSDCSFIGVEFYLRKVCVSIYYPRINRSTSHELQSKLFFYSIGNSPVLFQDSFYYVDLIGKVGKLKLEGENFTWEVLDKLRKPCSSFQYNFLVECGGELLSVYVERVGKWVHVYKLNESKSAWEIVSDLSNYNLYLSRSSSFSVMASPGEGNRIYFPRFRGCRIVFYSLDTAKWHFFGSSNSSTDFYDTKLMLDSCWIKPCWC